MVINNIQKLMLGLMELIIVAGTILFAIATKKQKAISVRQLIKQLCFIMVIVSGFNLAAACSKVVSTKPNISIYLLWFMTIVVLGLQLYIRKRSKTEKIDILEIIFEYKYLILVLTFSGILRYILMRDITVQRWDAGQYYYALGTGCENYQFTLSSFWDNFRLCNHSTLGFSLIMGIGEFLNPRGVQGVLYVNLILTIVALYCIYMLLRKFFANLDDKQAAMGVLLISMAPLFLGTFAYLNVDYMLAIAFIFMIYCEYKKQYLLLFFWGAVLVQTKETGVFVFAGYYIGHFVYWMVKKKGNLVKKIINIFEEKVTCATMGVAFTYAVYVFRLGAFTAWKYAGEDGNSVLWSNSGINCFGFQPRNIYLKCTQFFVLNFAWVLLAVLCILFFILIVKKKKIKICLKNMQGINGGIVAFVLFSFLYVTWDIERYNVLFVVLSIIIFYVLYQQVFEQLGLHKIRMILCGIICILFLGQTFMPIDMFSNKMFNVVSTETNQMLYTCKTMNYFGDPLINNYQYTWLDRTLDSVFKEIEYNEETTILLSAKQESGSHLAGNYMVYPIFWDKAKDKRVMYQNENTCLINVIEKIESNDYVPDSMVAIFIPYYGVDEEEVLSEYKEIYQISERHVVKKWGGSMSYYYMKKK